jgi:hypothetical protein
VYRSYAKAFTSDRRDGYTVRLKAVLIACGEDRLFGGASVGDEPVGAAGARQAALANSTSMQVAARTTLCRSMAVAPNSWPSHTSLERILADAFRDVDGDELIQQ